MPEEKTFIFSIISVHNWHNLLYSKNILIVYRKGVVAACNDFFNSRLLFTYKANCH